MSVFEETLGSRSIVIDWRPDKEELLLIFGKRRGANARVPEEIRKKKYSDWKGMVWRKAADGDTVRGGRIR